jgi:hypothetical protein
MTIQNWSCNPRGATVICDSLVTISPADRPNGLASKVIIVPHLALIVAVKNWVFPGALLAHTLAGPNSYTSWEHALAAAPDVLRHARHLQPNVPDDYDQESIVFMAGWSSEQHEVRGALFKGVAQWGFEPFLGSLLMPEVPKVDRESDYEHAVRQQQHDRSLPPEDRDNIGGFVVRVDLVSGAHGPEIVSRSLGRLPGFEEDAATYDLSAW